MDLLAKADELIQQFKSATNEIDRHYYFAQIVLLCELMGSDEPLKAIEE